MECVLACKYPTGGWKCRLTVGNLLLQRHPEHGDLTLRPLRSCICRQTKGLVSGAVRHVRKPWQGFRKTDHF